MSVQMGHTFPEIVLMVVLGILIWTLIEYTLHRFLFHIKTQSYWSVLISFEFVYLVEIIKLDAPLSLISEAFMTSFIDTHCRGNTIHYLLHGCHHKHPMDGLRLVFPPAATAVLCIPVSCVLMLVFLYDY